MTNQEKLQKVLELALQDWESVFEIETAHYDDGDELFEVVVRNKVSKVDVDLIAKVTETNFQMEVSDGVWEVITTEGLFAHMYFSVAAKLDAVVLQHERLMDAF